MCREEWCSLVHERKRFRTCTNMEQKMINNCVDMGTSENHYPHDQIIIEQSILDLIDLLDHGYYSIMLDHHRAYSSTLNHDYIWRSPRKVTRALEVNSFGAVSPSTNFRLDYWRYHNGTTPIVSCLWFSIYIVAASQLLISQRITILSVPDNKFSHFRPPKG